MRTEVRMWWFLFLMVNETLLQSRASVEEMNFSAEMEIASLTNGSAMATLNARMVLMNPWMHAVSWLMLILSKVSSSNLPKSHT